ncbi:predicted protein [Nematostella vectensis]|uniref:Cytoskeleton-associated protein 2 C-terminal domain-containing protein n=1 Tax=Nematostella vectensis TaxID=45351 RepID=A7RS14_NEMVE|nr:predicted protein [Nematostella vectensis]|eukprot:XP_001637786.1 predicted protein [Nematostella vectensis]
MADKQTSTQRHSVKTQDSMRERLEKWRQEKQRKREVQNTANNRATTSRLKRTLLASKERRKPLQVSNAVPKPPCTCRPEVSVQHRRAESMTMTSSTKKKNVGNITNMGKNTTRDGQNGNLQRLSERIQAANEKRDSLVKSNMYKKEKAMNKKPAPKISKGMTYTKPKEVKKKQSDNARKPDKNLKHNPTKKIQALKRSSPTSLSYPQKDWLSKKPKNQDIHTRLRIMMQLAKRTQFLYSKQHWDSVYYVLSFKLQFRHNCGEVIHEQVHVHELGHQFNGRCSLEKTHNHVRVQVKSGQESAWNCGDKKRGGPCFPESTTEDEHCDESVASELDDLQGLYACALLCAEFWVCRAKIAERQGDDGRVVCFFEQALVFRAEPEFLLKNAVTEYMAKKKGHQQVIDQDDEIVFSLPDDEKDAPPPNVQTPDPAARPKAPTVDDVPSSVVKYSVTKATPFKSRLQACERSVITPVRRSARLERRSISYPAMLQDHDLVVANLGDLSEDTRKEAVYKPNFAVEAELNEAWKEMWEAEL